MNIDEYRKLPPEEQKALWKDLLQRTVRRGEVKEVSGVVNMSDWMLYKLRDMECDKYNPLHHKIPEIIAATGRFEIPDFLATLFGCILYPLPRLGAHPGEIYREIGRTTKSVGQLLQVLTEALDAESPEEVKISLTEFLEIKAACDQAHACLASLEAAARLAQGGRKVVKGEEFQDRFPKKAGTA